MYRIKEIIPSDREACIRSEKVWDSIAKPLGSFGELERIVQKIAAVQGSEDVHISRRTVVVMCGDHGVVEEGVSQCGSSVTAECAAAIACGRSNVNAVAAQFGAEVIAVDMGIVSDLDCPQLIDRKTGYGTHNFTKGPAMDIQQVRTAVAVGMDIAGELASEGSDIIITGEMGIGNTTSASAIAAVLLGLPAEQVTGRGAGISDEGLLRKISAVKRGIEVNCPDPEKPMELLQKLGGFEIAGMTGLFLGGAYYGVPVVIDGVISAAAAAIAYKLAPACADYMLASHCSGEPAGEGLLRLMGLEPVINAGLRLGEGTGGVLLLPLIDGAVALYRNSHRFEDTNIERYRKY